eukprot:3916289-Rhodomonas_salina.2
MPRSTLPQLCRIHHDNAEQGRISRLRNRCTAAGQIVLHCAPWGGACYGHRAHVVPTRFDHLGSYSLSLVEPSKLGGPCDRSGTSKAKNVLDRYCQVSK